MGLLKQIERSAKRLVPEGWRKYFRASRYEVLMERFAPVDLIVHVGAHWGEDAGFYEACGARTVLWIHGLGESGLCFERLLARPDLADWQHVVADLPGYGRTAWPTAPRKMASKVLN